MKKAMKMMADREISNFCNQLAMILDSGISLSEGLEMMLEDYPSPEETQILTLLRDSLSQTGSFSDSLEQAGVFPDYMVQMVRIGEQTGHLDDVMEALTDHYDRSDSVHQSIRSAVFYPALMFGMMILIVVVLLTNVMPIFNQVFQQLGTELSGVSRMLLQLGAGIRRYAIVLTGAAAVIVLGLAISLRISKLRTAVMRVLIRIPSLRRLSDALFRFRFASGMALALSSGSAPEYALDMVQSLTADSLTCERIQKCKALLDEGQELSRALCTTKILTGTYSRMTAIGQKTGTMEQVMEQIAQASQEEFDQRTARLLGLIEPTLVAVLSVIVGIILMSVMFPLLGILSGI